MNIKRRRKIKWQTVDLFLLAIVVFFLLSFLYGNSAMDITLYDSYYVISNFYIAQGIAALCLIGWVIYKLLGPIMLSKTLTNIHVILSMLAAVCWIYLQVHGPLFMPPRKYYAFSAFNSTPPADFWFFALLLTTTPLVFLTNIVGGLTKKLIKKTKITRTN